MKKVFAFLLAFAMVAFAVVAFAHEEFESPEEVMERIMARQGVASASQLDCTQIPASDFEMLGDSVMERMAGNHQLHEQMDVMMGGEGSASLRSTHIAMGQNWLGCTTMMGTADMMNVNMMPMMMRMMGNFYPAYYSGYDTILLLAVTGWILFFGTLVYLYPKKTHKNR